jgi:AraC-like DNA-binding protein
VPYLITMFKRRFGVTPAGLRDREQGIVVQTTLPVNRESGLIS